MPLPPKARYALKETSGRAWQTEPVGVLHYCTLAQRDIRRVLSWGTPDIHIHVKGQPNQDSEEKQTERQVRFVYEQGESNRREPQLATINLAKDLLSIH